MKDMIKAILIALGIFGMPFFYEYPKIQYALFFVIIGLIFSVYLEYGVRS